MTLRHIEVASLDPITPADQPAPMLDWVPIAKIVIDDDFQRPLNRNNWDAIKRIAADFQWSRFAPVLLAPIEGGLYSCIDGQHRAHAAAICGFERVPAMITTVSKAEQARASVYVNGSQIRVSPHQVFRAALSGREPWAAACAKAVADAGCILMTRNNVSANDRQAGQIYCIGLVRKLVAEGKAWAVTAGLDALRQYDNKPALFADYVLTPWLTAVGSNPTFARADLLAVLRKRAPYLTLDAANRLAETEGKPITLMRRMAFEQQIRTAGFVAA